MQHAPDSESEIPTAGVIETTYLGQTILEHPLLNKGSAFTLEEREELGLLGLLPPHVSSMEEQLTRTYESYLRKSTNLERYIYLASLHDRNETLFYRLLQEHIDEMTPVVYTPVVGEACQNYSHIYRRPRGIYISYADRDNLDLIMENPSIAQTRIAVVTDGERILGLGDQGVDGMGIPVGKLALYTLCAGIHPATTLPIVLDVGTNNKDKLNDPLYMGWRHERIRGTEYDGFIDRFVKAFERRFPHALLQWEDFAKQNARRLLDRYRNELCTFNDDIQGTGAVTLAGILAALRQTGERMSDQRIVMFGAGSAAVGILEQIVATMLDEGTPHEEALTKIWLLNSRGLVHTEMSGIESEQKPFARPVKQIKEWGLDPSQQVDLATVVAKTHPTILIGVATVPNTFTEEIVRDMAAHTARPIIFPLSNPTSKCEAVPKDLIAWTEGRVLIGTGSPFDNVTYGDRNIRIGQCNNMYIFPGVGLGTLVTQARHVVDEMFLAAARALSELAPSTIKNDPDQPLFPALTEAQSIGRQVAIAVARAAIKAGVADPIDDAALLKRIDEMMWKPEYAALKRCPTHKTEASTDTHPKRHGILGIGWRAH
jgi:malate dehydrogenase (oxaloacetate-decarboxylating)